MNKLKILISAVLLYWLFAQYGNSAIDSLSRLHSFKSMMFLLFAIMLGFADKLLRTWNFKLILERSKIYIPYPRLVQISFVSMFFGLFFPGGAGPDIARVVQLKKYSQGLAKPASATIWVNIATVLAAGMLAFSGAVILMNLEVQFDPMFFRLVIIFSLTVLAVAFIVLNGKSQRYIRYLVEPVMLKRKGVLHRFAIKFLDAFSSQAEAWVLIRAVMVSSVVLLLAVTRTYFLSEALSLNVDFVYILMVLPLVLFITMIPVSFAGIGVREYSFVYFLGIVGVTEANAFLLGILVTLVNIMLSAVGGIVYLYSRSVLELNAGLRKNE